MSVTISPPMFLQFFNPNNSGAPASGYLLFTYIAGTSTKQATWTDSTQTVQNANPLILDSSGGGYVWGDPTLAFKFVWAPANDTDPPTSPIRTVDNLYFPLDLAALTQQFVGLILYPQTSAESSAGVTPVSYVYPPGNLLRYGGVGDGVTDNTSAINKWLSVSGPLAVACYAPAGTYNTTGAHTINAKQDIYGDGIQRTIFQHTSTTNTLFSIPLYGTNPAAVEFGGNRFRDFSCIGQGPTNSSEVAFFVYNKTDIKWDHIEITGFGYGVQGVRLNSANSCTQLSFIACRVLNCGYALWAPRQWNACTFIGGCWEGTIMSMVLYDADNTIVNTNVQTGSGASCAIFMAGCQGCTVTPYCEGSATVASGSLTWLPVAAFVIFSNTDITNNASPGAIALQINQGNSVPGGVFGSGTGVAYACLQNGGVSCRYESMSAGSGIQSGAVYFTTSTFWNLVSVNFSSAGVNVTYQTPTDEAFNFELNRYTGSARLPAIDTASIFLDEGNSSGTAEVAINKIGYQGGTTTFRRCTVYDGKGNILLQIDGATSAINLNTSTVYAANLPTTNPGGGTNRLWVNSGVIQRA